MEQSWAGGPLCTLTVVAYTRIERWPYRYLRNKSLASQTIGRTVEPTARRSDSWLDNVNIASKDVASS